MELKFAHKIQMISKNLVAVVLVILSQQLAATEVTDSKQNKLELLLQKTAEYSPGAILLVDHPDFHFRKAVGLANKEQQTQMQTNSTLRLGSITKTYISALTLVAEQKGLLKQTDTIDMYLPKAITTKLPDINPNIRQLLNHSSGIPDYYDLSFYLFDWDKEQAITPELVLDSIAGEEAVIQPGESFSYSNSNYHVLALILEKVFQQPLAQSLEQQLFQPLALNTTYYSQANPPGDNIHGYGAPIMPWNGPLFPWVDTYTWRENSGPDGGMFASLDDLNHWLRSLYAQGGKLQELGAIMIDSPLQQSKRKQQGLGTEILYSKNGDKIIGHTGSIDGYMSAAFYIPKLDTSLILHVNYSDGDAFSQTLGQILKTLLQAQ